MNLSTGHYSTGDHSTGNWSTGHYSTGDHSTGHYSTGDRSTGNHSTGHYSTGNHSTGHRSTGNWSISNFSSGHFSTIDNDGFGAFNKPCAPKIWMCADIPDFLYFDLNIWIIESEMTSLEKNNFASYKTTGGYIKILDYKEAFQESYKKASEEEKYMLLKLPNFDADVFLQISGIDVRIDDENESKKKELIKKAEELLEQANKM